MFDGDLVRGLRGPALKGSYTVTDALAKLLSGTGLEAVRSANGAWRIIRSGEARETAVISDPPVEVVVTGTHIREANPTSPVHVLSRQDIDRSGYSQIGDLMRSLPENFSGGQNPGVFAASYGDNINYSNASTVNLRGLGTDATLVLLNGHRMSPDSVYQGVDISTIPLAAVKRVEVVTDGASAVYGSDAVAGVVNMILNRDFEGAQVSARYGTSAHGAAAERTVNALAGGKRGNWHFLGSIERSIQDPLRASDRSFTSAVSPSTTLLQGQKEIRFL